MTVKVLYNNCLGVGFSFSDEFVAEYERRAGKRIEVHRALFRNGPDSIRCDPIAVAIFEEKGTAWCSGKGSEIAIYDIPAALTRYWEIEEDEGDEYVRIMVAEALADILHTFMETGDLAVLKRQYATIIASSELKKDPNVHRSKDEYNDPYSYFGV